MPPPNDPALGAAPVWTMPASELDAALDLLGDVDGINRDKLRADVMVEADRYLRRTKQEGAMPALSRQRAQLAKVRNAAGRLVEELEKLASNPDAEFAFLYQLQRLSRDAEVFNIPDLATSMNIDVVRDLIAWLRDGATGEPSFLDDRSGSKSRPSLYLFVLSLCRIYEQITENWRPTILTRRRGMTERRNRQPAGSPHSSCGWSIRK